jgi:hypothetical protein
MEHDKKGKPKGLKEDWVALFKQFKQEEAEATKLAQAENVASRKKGAKMSLPLAEYCGIYTSEMYGDVIITIDDNPLTPFGGLKIIFEPTALFQGQLTHWHYDTFELSWSTQMMLPKGKATFVIDSEGKPCELKVMVDNPDFDFTELRLLRMKQ